MPQVSASPCADSLQGSSRNFVGQGQVFKYSLKGNLVSHWTTVAGNTICISADGPNSRLSLTDCSYKTFANKWLFNTTIV